MSAAGPKSVPAAGGQGAVERAVDDHEVDVVDLLAEEDDVGLALCGDGGRVGQVTGHRRDGQLLDLAVDDELEVHALLSSRGLVGILQQGGRVGQ